MAIVHMVYISLFHVTANYLPHYLVVNMNITIKTAGFITSVSYILVTIILIINSKK